MTPRTMLFCGAVCGAIGVAAGAFGAHGLKDKLSPELLETFEVAVRYQMYHSLALLAVGLIAERRDNRALRLAAWLFLAGQLLFAGSLYVWVLSGLKLFAALFPPLGGSCYIAGWLALAWGSGIAEKKVV